MLGLGPFFFFGSSEMFRANSPGERSFSCDLYLEISAVSGSGKKGGKNESLFLEKASDEQHLSLKGRWV